MLFNQVQAKAPPKKTFLEIVSWRKKKKNKNPDFSLPVSILSSSTGFGRLSYSSRSVWSFEGGWFEGFWRRRKSREGFVCLRKKWSSGDQMLWIWFCCWGCKGKGVFSPYHHILFFIYFYFLFYFLIFYFFYYYTWHTNVRQSRNDGNTPRSVKLD